MLSRDIQPVSRDIFASLWQHDLPLNWHKVGRQYVDQQPMATLSNTPLYQLVAKTGKRITVDVTSSVSAGLPPNKLFDETLIKVFRSKNIESIVDFGAGALRHTFPLLDAGFQVCAVEFEQQFKKPICSEAIRRAEKHPNFCKLIFPGDFGKDTRRFDAALLCYVIQTMPVKDERNVVSQDALEKAA